MMKTLRRHPWDYVIGALHYMGNTLIFDRAYFDRAPDEAYHAYFVELGAVAEEGGIWSAGRPTSSSATGTPTTVPTTRGRMRRRSGPRYRHAPGTGWPSKPTQAPSDARWPSSPRRR